LATRRGVLREVERRGRNPDHGGGRRSCLVSVQAGENIKRFATKKNKKKKKKKKKEKGESRV
jgi:hypothetical protein